MNQPFSEELLSAYLDQELSPAQRKDVEQRLQSDPAAQQQLADFQKLSHLLRDLPKAQPPSGFAEQVMLQAERNALLREPLPAAATAAPAAPAQRTWLKPTLGIVAAAAAVVFIVQAVPLPGPDEKPEGFVAMEMESGPESEFHVTHHEPDEKLGRAPEADSLLFTTTPAEASTADDQPAAAVAQDGQAEPSDEKADVETILPTPADAIAKKRILQDGPWDSSRIGEVIDVARTDGEGKEIMVFKAVVTNIDKWVGGTDVDVIGLNQSGPPSTIAVHIEATPSELATFVAKLSEDGQQLLTFEPGTPVTLASLPQESRKSFAWSLAKPTPAVKEAEGQSTKSSQIKTRSHTAPTTFGAEESPEPAPDVADNNVADNTTADQSVRGDSGEKAAPSPAGRARVATVPPTKKPLVTKVPVVLEEQLIVVETPGLPVPQNQAQQKDERGKGTGPLSFNQPQPRLKVILLVRQNRPAAPEAPPEKKAGDGGGAA